jgi:hypothetical protein
METSGTTFFIRNFPEASAERYKLVKYAGKYGKRYKPWLELTGFMVVFNLDHCS